MARQIKCHHCHNWTDASAEICDTCKNPLFQKPKVAETNDKNGYQNFVNNLKNQSGWIDQFFEKTKTSDNILYRMLGYFLRFMWMIYFSILLFIAWLVFVIAG